MSESSVSATPARVTLINPPSAPGTLANREGAAGMGVVYSAGESFLYPPHTIAAVAASLRQAGHAIRVLDLVVGSADADALQADVIGVLISWATLRSDLEFLTSLRAQTAARLVAFGSAMRFLAERVALDSPVDAVVVGEPEGCLSEAVEFIRTTCTGGPTVLTNDTLHATRCDADGWIKDLFQLKKLEADHEDLKMGSVNYVQLKEKYDSAREELAAARQKVEELSEKLDDLQITEKVTWFLVGGAVLLVGWIIGISMGLYNKKRRASYHF